MIFFNAVHAELPSLIASLRKERREINIAR